MIQRLKKDFAAAKEEFEAGEVGVCRDILKTTIDEWDRIIVRPYREVEQLQTLYLKCLKVSQLSIFISASQASANEISHIACKENIIHFLLVLLTYSFLATTQSELG